MNLFSYLVHQAAEALETLLTHFTRLKNRRLYHEL